MINDNILKLIDWIAKHEHGNIFLLCEYIFTFVLCSIEHHEAWLSYFVSFFSCSVVSLLLGFYRVKLR